MIDLSAAGLTPTEAKCYTALLNKKDWKPAELAKFVRETRTNCYKILDNLVSYKLAERFDKDKKLHYRATNPSRLLQLARDQRARREQADKQLELNAQNLMHTYVTTNEQADVRYFQGEVEISQVFKEIANAKEEVVFVHTKAGVDFYGFKAMHNLRMRAPQAGVQRRALTPDFSGAPTDYEQTDPLVLLKRTWVDKDAYTAPVEWGAFDNKLYIISYGKEALGLIIDSEQIAGSFKQLFGIMERGQRLLPDYETLPRFAKKLAVTEPQLP